MYQEMYNSQVYVLMDYHIVITTQEGIAVVCVSDALVTLPKGSLHRILSPPSIGRFFC